MRRETRASMEIEAEETWSGTAARAGGLLSLVTLLALGPAAVHAPAQEAEHAGHAEAADHEAGAQSADQSMGPLTEPGNAAFAAIREVVKTLNAREDTDWSRVDLEALRRHLRDMRRFTTEAEIVEREPVDGGLRVVVRGTDPEASGSIRRALRAHAPMLERETGWSASVDASGEGTSLLVTGAGEEDARKIRGLGYIGLMATGAHHARHHWMIATGRSPHR